MAEMGVAAFSVFFMQSPSFLAHQRHLAQGAVHGRSNCETLFGMTKIPSDNHIRDMLDGVPPECFHPPLIAAFDLLERAGGLTAFRRLRHHALFALGRNVINPSCQCHLTCPSTPQRSTGNAET